MRRGEIYLVRRPEGGDPRALRPFIVVSRDAFIEARWSTVICAPVYSTIRGVETEVIVGEESGLKHPSAIACDALVSLARGLLTDFLGTLPRDRVVALDRALALAVGVEHLLDT